MKTPIARPLTAIVLAALALLAAVSIAWGRRGSPESVTWEGVTWEASGGVTWE